MRRTLHDNCANFQSLCFRRPIPVTELLGHDWLLASFWLDAAHVTSQPFYHARMVMKCLVRHSTHINKHGSHIFGRGVPSSTTRSSPYMAASQMSLWCAMVQLARAKIEE